MCMGTITIPGSQWYRAEAPLKCTSRGQDKLQKKCDPQEGNFPTVSRKLMMVFNGEWAQNLCCCLEVNRFVRMRVLSWQKYCGSGRRELLWIFLIQQKSGLDWIWLLSQQVCRSSCFQLLTNRCERKLFSLDIQATSCSRCQTHQLGVYAWGCIPGDLRWLKTPSAMSRKKVTCKRKSILEIL